MVFQWGWNFTHHQVYCTLVCVFWIMHQASRPGPKWKIHFLNLGWKNVVKLRNVQSKQWLIGHSAVCLQCWNIDSGSWPAGRWVPTQWDSFLRCSMVKEQKWKNNKKLFQWLSPSLRWKACRISFFERGCLPIWLACVYSHICSQLYNLNSSEIRICKAR